MFQFASIQTSKINTSQQVPKHVSKISIIQQNFQQFIQENWQNSNKTNVLRHQQFSLRYFNCSFAISFYRR
jgi:hypothetical protein